MYRCISCGKKSLVWYADFRDEEGGYIMHACHCTNCGAEFECMRLPKDKEEKACTNVFIADTEQ